MTEPLCTGKVAFDSFELADQAAKRPRRNGSRRTAYRCPDCRRWHLAGVQPYEKPHRQHRRTPKP